MANLVLVPPKRLIIFYTDMQLLRANSLCQALSFHSQASSNNISAQHLQYRPRLRLTMSLLNVPALDGIQGTRAHLSIGNVLVHW